MEEISWEESRGGEEFDVDSEDVGEIGLVEKESEDVVRKERMVMWDMLLWYRS